MGPKWSLGTVTMMRPLAALALPLRTALQETELASAPHLLQLWAGCSPPARQQAAEGSSTVAASSWDTFAEQGLHRRPCSSSLTRDPSDCAGSQRHPPASHTGQATASACTCQW